MWLRSACRTRAPSGSTRTSSGPVMSRRPSGSQLDAHPSPSGPSPTTSLVPSRSTATICLVPQFENHSRPSCQRGDSGMAKPSSNTRVCMRLLRRDYRLDHRQPAVRRGRSACARPRAPRNRGERLRRTAPRLNACAPFWTRPPSRRSRPKRRSLNEIYLDDRHGALSRREILRWLLERDLVRPTDRRARLS